MAKAKKTKVKEPIALRQKALANGDYSLYLDIYQNGKRSYKFLKLYLHPENDDDAIKLQNGNTLRAANAIKAQMIIDIANEKAGISKVSYRSEMLVSDYLNTYIKNSKSAHRGGSYGNNIASMSNRLFEYMGDNADTTMMKDVDVNFCRGFVAYLYGAMTSMGKPLSKVTCFHYFSTFKNMLTDAVIDDVISINPIDKMKKNEKPKRPEIEKPYLNVNEVKALMQTDCRNEMVKRAFLFSCFTGLRISDVLAFKWGDIWQDGDTWRYTITMKKTQKPFNGKLSSMAYTLLPNMKNGKGLVFDLPTVAVIEKILKQWAQVAGITKNVTFHTARHSYATMELTAGASLYTVAETLGHKSVATAMIYAKVVDKARDEATDGVSNLFKKGGNNG